MFWGTMCDKKIPALKKFLKTMSLNMRLCDIIITRHMDMTNHKFDENNFLKIGYSIMHFNVSIFNSYNILSYKNQICMPSLEMF
jgi:hypothetical protein